MFGNKNTHVIYVYNTFGDMLFNTDDREAFIDFIEDIDHDNKTIERIAEKTVSFNGKVITKSEYVVKPKKVSQ